MRRARRARLLATAVGTSALGKTPIISHLLSPVCTQSSYCFHLAMVVSKEHLDATYATAISLHQSTLKYPPPVKCSCASFQAAAQLSAPAGARIIHTLPAKLLALVLLVEPLLQWRKVIQDGCGIHLPLSADGLERVRPGSALAHAQHHVQLFTRGLVLVDGTPM